MKEIYLNSRKYQLPESWQEVDSDLLPQLLVFLYVHPESGATYHEILRLVLGYSPAEWQKLMRHYFAPTLEELQREINAMVLQEVLQLISWMWTQELTKKPFEYVLVGGIAHLLPDEEFRTVSFGELSDAYIHSRAFIEQLVEGDERLNYLMATICRPEWGGDDYKNDLGWNGDARQPYNEHIAKARAKDWDNVPYETRIVVLMYFLGTLKTFLGMFDIWQGDGPASEEEYPGQSWIKNQHLLAEKHIFGGMAPTKAANVHEVFSFLEENSKDIKRKIEQEKANQR